MRALLLVLLSIPASALAQGAIYKCVDAQGTATYQNAPCASGEEIADVRTYMPLTRREAREAEEDRLQRIAADQRRQAQSLARQQATRAARRPTPAQTARQRCNDARRDRDQARKQAPLWRDVHYLEPWEKRVREACKGLW